MKKIILLCLIFPCIMVNASEITEDYFDIASNYCTYGNYKDALTYIEKIISIEPANTNAIEMKNSTFILLLYTKGDKVGRKCVFTRRRIRSRALLY